MRTYELGPSICAVCYEEQIFENLWFTIMRPMGHPLGNRGLRRYVYVISESPMDNKREPRRNYVYLLGLPKVVLPYDVFTIDKIAFHVDGIDYGWKLKDKPDAESLDFLIRNCILNALLQEKISIQ